MTIKGRFPETLTSRECYRLTQSSEMSRVTDISDGEVLDMSAHVIFMKNEVELLTFTLKNDPTDTVYVTSSKTFINSFKNILECMKNESFVIRKTSGISKNNRHFINCELV